MSAVGSAQNTARAGGPALVGQAARGAGPRRSLSVGRGGPWFVLPFLLVYAAFLLWPLVYGLGMSFTDTSLVSPDSEFVGLDNYAQLASDPLVWRTLGITLLFTVLSTVPLVLVALVMALLVHTGTRGQWFWRFAYFAPFLLPVSTVVLVTVWWTVGFNFLLYLSALQAIPATVYEAASLDGADGWRRLFSITLPLLKVTTGLVVVLQVLASLKLFDQAYILYGGSGGPAGNASPILQYVYDTGFVNYRLGYASAISYAFFLIIIVVAVLQARLTSRKES